MARKKKEEEEYTFVMDQSTVDFFNNYDGDPWGSMDESNNVHEYLTNQEQVDYYNNFFKNYNTELKNYYEKYINSEQNNTNKPKTGKDKFTDIGVDIIKEEEYQFLIDIDNQVIENKKNQYKENRKNKTFRQDATPLLTNNDNQYYNEYVDKGWIIRDGKYYEPLNNSLPEPSENTIEVDGKKYIEVTSEEPMTLVESKDYLNYIKVNNSYSKYFEQFNKAIEEGEYNTANNILQKINEKYFGHSYEDGILGFTYFNDKDQNALLKKESEIFNEKLTIINALKTTTDPETIAELNKRLQQLEFEDKLIDYNRSITLASVNEKTNKLDNIIQPVINSWKKTGELWTETFDDWDDGYQFGDIFGTAKNIINNTFQTVGSLGKNITGGFSGIENLMFNDLNDSQFKEVWAPAIVDVATYLIPYVGQARIAANYFEPASVISSFVLQEGSATIDTDDGSIRVANKYNAAGAVVNIAANFLSDMIFAGIKASFTKATGEKTMAELSKRWFKSSGTNIIKNIIKTGSLEAIEEFAQTYGEYMQNITSDDLPPGFFKEHFKEALEAAFVAMVVASGAEGVGSTIGTMRNNTSQSIENYRVNEAVINKTINAGVAYNSSDIDNYEKLNYKSYDQSQVNVGNTEIATQGIATELSNNNVVTLVNSNVADTDVLTDPHAVEISNASIADGTTMTLSPSQEMTNYIKQINKDAIVFTFDPNSDTFYQDLIDFMENANSRMVFKNISQFTPVDYKFSPTEVNDINAIVTDFRNRGNVLDNINGKVELKPISTSDIQDTNITTFMNNIKSKFLEDINDGIVTKDTAQREFKKMSEKLAEYINKSTIERSYIKDNTGKIISFFKTGDNTYEAVNTLPRGTADFQVYANVKTNGNIINGNLNSKIGITKGQANAVNKIIDALKLKGNYLTTDSTGKEIATLIKLNKEMSKEILQALGADGIIEGKNKVRLTTAYSGLDNANFEKVVKRTIEDMSKPETKAEIKKQASTVAPTKITESTKTNIVSSTSAPIDAKYNITPDGDSPFVNMDVAQELDNMFKELEISDSKGKLFMGEDLKTKIRQSFFSSYEHIEQIANPNDDTFVRAAISGIECVASDAQTMINNAQMMNNEYVGKSLKQIFKPLDGSSNKKKKQMFEKYMLLELNIERENAGVEKVLDKVSKEQSRKTADKILKKYPEFKGIANDLQKYNNNLLDMLVDGGVIDEAKSEMLKKRYKFYMPIYTSELSAFGNLGDEKYFKDMKVDNTIKDVTKTAKYVQSLDKSLESKTYNVLSAVAKNKLANAMNDSGKYTGDGSADLIFYQNGKITKMKTTTGIVDDINNNTILHWVDKLQNDYAVFRGIKALNNIAYKFILDPFFRVGNVMVDLADSALIYSKDKVGFIKHYPIAAVALANNSELYNEFKRYNLASQGKTEVEYDSNGNIKSVKENNFDRIYNNLENLPKFADYMSLSKKYIAQVEKDYDKGLYTIEDNHIKFNSDEKDALEIWVGPNSYFINENLRAGTEQDIKDKKLLQSIDDLTRALNKYKSISGTFNRSIMFTNEQLQEFLSRYKEGNIVTEKAFTSMSYDIYDASWNVQMKIKTDNAKDVSKIMRSDEKELLLQRGSQFRVDKITNENGKYYLELTDVSPDTSIFKSQSLKDTVEDNHLISKQGQDFNEFNKTIVKGHNGKPVYISRHTSQPDEIDHIRTYKQNNIDNYGWWYANSPTDSKYYNSNEADKFINELFNKSTVKMLKDKKGVYATISEEYLTPPSNDEITNGGRYNYIEGHLTGKIFDISQDGDFLPFDVSNASEIDTRDKVKALEQKRRDTVTQIYTNLKNKYDKDNKYSLDDFRKYIPLVDALKLDGYTGIVNDYNNGTKEIIIFDESKFMSLKEYNELNNKNTTVKDNILLKNAIEEAKLRAALDARDVNLDFNKGGKVTKALSKAGFKFINAGFLGFDKFLTHINEGTKTPKAAGKLMLEFVAVGATTAIANAILNNDDEDYEKLPYYYKNNYFMIKIGDGEYLRIPRGRVQSLYNVIFEYATGIRTEDDFETYFKSITDSFESAALPPSFTEASPIAAFQQIIKNEDSFGNKIYDSDYDDTFEKIKKSGYHLLSSYFGRYGRIIKDLTDNDVSSDWLNEFTFYKDTSKANKHYSTAYNLIQEYRNKKKDDTSVETKVEKKYLEVQYKAIQDINKEINDAKESGASKEDMKVLYAARDDLLLSMITNYKNYDVEYIGDGKYMYYFDDRAFLYNSEKDTFTKKW